MAEKIIKLSSFPYKGADGIERTALRGGKVDITEDADLERGERLGVFATDEDLKEGTVFGDFYAARQAKESSDEGASDSELAEQPAVKPKGNASRDAWAAYATAQGASEDETRPEDEGGLSRDALRDKYGS